MSQSTKQLLDTVRSLPYAEREEFIAELLNFDDDEHFHEDEENFLKELECRIDDIESGRVKPIPWTSAEQLILDEENGV